MTVIQYFGLYGCYIVVSVVCLEGLFVVIIYIYNHDKQYIYIGYLTRLTLTAPELFLTYSLNVHVFKIQRTHNYLHALRPHVRLASLKFALLWLIIIVDFIVYSFVRI